MKVTVCQLSGRTNDLSLEWNQLITHCKQEKPELLLLPELPFYAWFTTTKGFNDNIWNDAVKKHDEWEKRIPELDVNYVLYTRATNEKNNRYNKGKIYLKETTTIEVHTKHYLPNEEGFWEANWYHPGEKMFLVHEFDNFKVGFQICSDMWFLNHSRDYGQQGIDLLAVPRCTEKATVKKWIIGGQAVGIVSGAYCISSNHHGLALDGKTELGGAGWIIDPDGDILGVTSEEKPFLTLDIEIDKSRKAKSTYPRYMKE